MPNDVLLQILALLIRTGVIIYLLFPMDIAVSLDESSQSRPWILYDLAACSVVTPKFVLELGQGKPMEQLILFEPGKGRFRSR